jgi:glycosyl transferase, family 25
VRAIELLAQMDAWDIVLWGWNFDSILAAQLLPGLSKCVLIFDQNELRKNALDWRKSRVDARLYKLFRAFGLVCYSVSPRGAERLLHYTTPVRESPVFFPILNRVIANGNIDAMMNGAYPTLDAFVCFPPLAVTYNERATSTTVQPAPVVEGSRKR